jgi:DNA invertase Pin-like site-specific DNA recombinase
MSTAVYIRVSSRHQNLESQRAEILKWLNANGKGEGVLWFEDKQTGKHLQRPGFEALQRAIFAGEVDTIVVWKLDRLSRSMRDGMNTLMEWLSRDMRLVSVTQQFDWSQMIASVIFAIAQMERETSRERQAAGIEVAKEQGKYKGRKLRTTKAEPARARELCAQLLTVKEIAAAMRVSPRTVATYLRSE